MRNPFRIHWNAYFYQYNLLGLSKQLASYRRYDWMTFWPNHTQMRYIPRTELDYLDRMSIQHATGFDLESYVNSHEECDDRACDDENTVLSRLATLQANDFLRG